MGVGVRHWGTVSYGRDSVAWTGQRVTAAFRGICQWVTSEAKGGR